MWEYILPIVSFFLGLFLSKRFLKFMYSVISGMRRVYTIMKDLENLKRAIAKLEEVVNEYGGLGRSDKGQP